jgi:ABC-type Fe3+-citrate transport system substrate-binding protein
MKTTKFLLLSIFTLSILAWTACSKSNNSLAAFQPEISNTTDNFQLQATKVQNVTTTLSFDWTNSGSTANIDKSGAVSSGTAKVTIFDANNTQVYTGDLKLTGSQQTATGVAGKWKIILELSGTAGDLKFRVQKG